MAEFQSRYVAKKPNSQGYVSYSDEENLVWRRLYERQIKLMAKHACKEHIDGLEKLKLCAEAIPQLPDVCSALKACTGWQVRAVTALISHDKFFNLLAHQEFPAATFIRSLEDFDYVKEPDIFHELFGHCPMLSDVRFANFVRDYGKMVLAQDHQDWPLLQRLFWFTVEFGLIQTDQGLRTYGGGILSSYEETSYCTDSPIPERKPFVPLDVFRTPYRIDILQPIYFVIEDYQQLYDFLNSDIKGTITQARELGEFDPKFPVKKDDPNIHIFAC